MSAEFRLLRWPDRQRDDYERLASALSRVREAAARARGEITVTVPVGPQEPDDVDRARALYAQRRARDAAAGSDADLFADPAWDMLLTLFIAAGSGRTVDRVALLEASAVKPAAALRWLAVLADRGLVDRADPPTMTPAGIAFVRRCVGSA